jgi:hypothetical protein
MKAAPLLRAAVFDRYASLPSDRTAERRNASAPPPCECKVRLRASLRSHIKSLQFVNVAMQKAGYAGILFGLTRSAPAIGGHQISKDRPLF